MESIHTMASDILKKYKEVFGEDPVFTGVNFDEPFPYDELLRAIETKIPYIEEPVPEGAKA